MITAREMVESDLSLTLEGDFASTDDLGNGLVTLIDPDGAIYSGLKGRVDYDYIRTQPTGEVVVVHKPVITLRRSSLPRVPKSGETWFVKMPIAPHAGAPIGNFILDDTQAPEGSETLGFVKFFPQQAVQA